MMSAYRRECPSWGQTPMTTDIAFARALRRHVFLPILAGSLFAYSAALAQSTGSQTVEQVVVTGKRQVSTGGLAVQVRTAKDQSVVTQQFIQTQIGSSNFAQLIDMMPGVTYSTEDPTGVLSSDFRMHGYDGAHISFTIDGSPVNDTGNYAIYPGEYLAAEVIDHVTVNLGQTEVDSPSASAIGGTVNVVSKLPSETPETTVKLTGGSYDYGRAYGEVDTGALGPTAVRSFLSVNYIDADKYKGAGNIERWGLDGKAYQPLSDSGFLSVGFTYASDRPYFYESDSRAQIGQFGRDIDWNTQWAVPTAVAGSADGIVPSSASAPGFEQGNDSYYWKLHPNPVDFGDIRGQSRFDLGHNVIVTFDPYFFYTLANGGGYTSLKEADPRLIGSGAVKTCTNGGSGVDLNGDGDCKDTVLFYSPSDTQTHRYGLNSSLIYDLDAHNRFQLTYTLDYGRHRQTGLFTTINQATGDPANVFGGLNGYGPPVLAEDGTPLRTRDRFSIAMLNQISANYIGKFFDDRLHVNIGLRDPYFQRDLNQYCYTYNGSSAWCDSISPALVQAAITNDTQWFITKNSQTPGALIGGSVAPYLTALLGTLYPQASSTTPTNPSSPVTSVYYNPNGTPNFRMPFSKTYNFNKLLPNVGASYDFDDHNQVYVTFAEGFSAPKTDDLYTSTPELVQPETSNQYGLGYRYHSPSITASVNLWGGTWNNRIVQSYDPNDPTISIDRNVGTVDLYGADFEAAWRATENLSFYFSGDLIKSQLQSNYEVTYGAGPDKGASVALPVKGKELVMTPDQQFSVRGEYKIGDVTLGLDAKYTGRRFISDMNDASVGGYTVVDFDAVYNFNVWGKKTSLAFNVLNLFAQQYYSRSSTVGNAVAIVSANGDTISASTPYLYIGAPTTAYVTLKTTF
jgi:iron complex outermembrane receptor protein